MNIKLKKEKIITIIMIFYLVFIWPLFFLLLQGKDIKEAIYLIIIKMLIFLCILCICTIYVLLKDQKKPIKKNIYIFQLQGYLDDLYERVFPMYIQLILGCSAILTNMINPIILQNPEQQVILGTVFSICFFWSIHLLNYNKDTTHQTNTYFENNIYLGRKHKQEVYCIPVMIIEQNSQEEIYTKIKICKLGIIYKLKIINNIDHTKGLPEIKEIILDSKYITKIILEFLRKKYNIDIGEKYLNIISYYFMSNFIEWLSVSISYNSIFLTIKKKQFDILLSKKNMLEIHENDSLEYFTIFIIENFLSDCLFDILMIENDSNNILCFFDELNSDTVQVFIEHFESAYNTLGIFFDKHQLMFEVKSSLFIIAKTYGIDSFRTLDIQEIQKHIYNYVRDYYTK